MRFVFAAIDGRIAHTSVVGVHIDFQAHATFLAHFRPALHLVPQAKIIRSRCKKLRRFVITVDII